LDKGGSVTALISLFDLSVDDAEFIAKRYNALKEFEQKNFHNPPEKDDEVQKLERDVRLGELRKRKLEQEKPLQFETTLSELRTTISHQGSYNKRNCTYFQDNYCRRWFWSSRPSLLYQIGEPLEKNGEYYINPDFIKCATCPLFRERGAISIEGVSNRVSTVENRVVGLQGTVDGIGRRLDGTQGTVARLEWKFDGLQRTVDEIVKGLNGTPDYNIRNRHKCTSCGATGLVAVKIVCASCGADNGSWGFYPEKKK
jgi:hypothetical protein